MKGYLAWADRQVLVFAAPGRRSARCAWCGASLIQPLAYGLEIQKRDVQIWSSVQIVNVGCSHCVALRATLSVGKRFEVHRSATQFSVIMTEGAC